MHDNLRPGLDELLPESRCRIGISDSTSLPRQLEPSQKAAQTSPACSEILLAVPHPSGRSGTQAGCPEVVRMYRVLWRFQGSQTWQKGIFVSEEKMTPRKMKTFIAHNRVLGIEARFVRVKETRMIEYGRPSSQSREEARHVR